MTILTIVNKFSQINSRLKLLIFSAIGVSIREHVFHAPRRPRADAAAAGPQQDEWRDQHSCAAQAYFLRQRLRAAFFAAAR